MFMEKILALMGDVPVQFYPVCYAFGFIAFLWIELDRSDEHTSELQSQATTS